MRKFLLVAVVEQCFPGTRVQVWFGAMTCLIFVIILLRSQPYRDRMCGALALGATVQLAIVYL